MPGVTPAEQPSSVDVFTSIRYDAQCADVEPDNGPFYMLNFHRDRLLEAATHFNYQGALDRYEGVEGLSWLRENLEEAVKDWQRDHADDAAAARGEGPLAVRAVFTSTGYMKAEIRPVAPVTKNTLYPTNLPPPLEISSSETSSEGAKTFKPSPLTGGAAHTSSSNHEIHEEHSARPTRGLTIDTQATHSSPFTVFKTLNRAVYDDARDRILPRARDDHQQFAADAHDVLMYDEDGVMSETSLATPYFWRGGRWVTPAVSAADATVREMRGGQRGSTRRWALANALCVEGKVLKDDIKLGELCWVSSGVRGFALGVVLEGGGLSTATQEKE